MAREPDVLEKVVRFVCGALLGLLLASQLFLWAFSDIGANRWLNIVFGSAVVVIAGLLAMKFGDRFWRSALFRGIS